ncbi:MAG: hypothetical protein ABI606_12560 [Rhodoferax sp.]
MVDSSVHQSSPTGQLGAFELNKADGYPHHKELGERVARRAHYWVEREIGGLDKARRTRVSMLDLRDLNAVLGQLRSLVVAVNALTDESIQGTLPQIF